MSESLKARSLGIALVCLVGASAVADVTYLENFESQDPGAVPKGWNGSGGGVFGVVAGENHTGIGSPWATPNFGAGGSQALGLGVGAGASSASAAFVMSSGATGSFVLNFALQHESGLTGTLGIRLFGDAMGSQSALTTYLFDLGSGAGTVTTIDALGDPQSTDLGSLPDVWTEHMLMVTPHGLARTCDHCANITYWSTTPALAQNFIGMEITLDTDASSLGGRILIDDVSLENVPGVGTLALLGLAGPVAMRRRR